MIVNNGDVSAVHSAGVMTFGGANHVLNNGSIYGGENGVLLGLIGTAGDNLVNTGLIEAGASRQIGDRRFENGVQIKGDNTGVTNSGTIAAADRLGGSGIHLGALGVGSASAHNISITNTATEVIQSAGQYGISAQDCGTGNFTLVNYGLIGGAAGSIIGGGTSGVILNSGTLQGRVDLTLTADARLVNAGAADGDNFFGSGLSHLLRNSGTISGDVTIGAGSIAVVNHGVLDGSVADNGATALIRNFGTITGGVHLYAGTDDFINRGTVEGYVALSAAGSTYNGTGGRVLGAIYGGSGGTTILGGSDFDLVIAGNGGDVIKTGGGDDSLVGGGDKDFLTGGAVGVALVV